MQETQARSVAKQLEAFASTKVDRYEVDKLETVQVCCGIFIIGRTERRWSAGIE